MKGQQIANRLPAKKAEEITKKPYQKPALTVYGDARDLTLGPTRGLGETGDPLNYRLGN